MKTWNLFLAALFLAAGINVRVAQAEVQQSQENSSVESPRERTSFNAHWRFKKDDPQGNSVPLLYDVRPDVQDAKTNHVADARPQEAEELAAKRQAVLKPWI